MYIFFFILFLYLNKMCSSLLHLCHRALPEWSGSEGESDLVREKHFLIAGLVVYQKSRPPPSVRRAVSPPNNLSTLGN